MEGKIKMLVLSVTGDCNYACKYCYASDHSPQYMTEDIARRSVDLARSHGETFVIQFSGGEPLLNMPVIKSVVSYVEEQGLPAKLQIQTNGSLLTDDICRYLYAHKVAIGLSLDGRPEINDALRITKEGKGATAETLKGFQVLRRHKIATGITCVVTAQNVDYLEGIVDMAYYLGNVRRIGFDILRGQGRGTNLVPPSAEAMEGAMKRVYARAKTLAKLAGYSLHFSQQERVQVLQQIHVKEFGHCYAMNGEAAFVDGEGKIYACASFVDDPAYYIGDVWTGLIPERLEAVNRRMSQAMAFCKDCEDFALCGGGCFARWYGSTSGEKEPYECECALKRESIKEVLARQGKGL